ncbi:2-oxoacid:ferredoxin oxidoreductase, gamma subunit [Desulfosporosinus orientis DSM 765]|uniref:2-oxoacid:ferredoxin oxidoreductase, gamma subunit n=1 Tax=Desulfosporosinus orientis (strain ATCC 19365 / DSM 765 / NCIMB 8382 / VKM B-1628 / Singapore I) TaxID=768706 RepID=G7W6X1_DESOD|nr:indolepyruvate oxidoreductase subunit beta [Desulfosporosinus orientis]AET69828.1 2-oxoacid:ferredoxin oxidoreductase, gamma subunit [Desulfosporosinus orientis DSM 765]
MAKSILLVGVGGQGTILASKLLTMGLMEAGFDVKMSEIHGMSQRGGSVSSQVRYGDKVESPVIELGGADILVSFEKMEALRWLNYVKPEGKVVVNDYEIPSTPILSGKVDYPAGIIEELSGKVETITIDAGKRATELGNPKVMNVILLGTIIKSMGLEAINWEKIVRDNIKPQFVDLNLRALQAGMYLV